MISPKDIKNKIRAVRNIEQICRAMKTVASIRLRRAEQRLAAARPYHRRLADLVAHVAGISQAHPFLESRPTRRSAAMVITSDRGLCGGYNAHTIRRSLLLGGPSQVAVIAVGRRGMAQMARRGYEIAEQVVPLGGQPNLHDILRLADRIGARYQAGEWNRLVLLYARFLGGSRWRVEEEVVLPVTRREMPGVAPIFEPKLGELLPVVLIRYLRSRLVLAVMEGSASEHAARVAAMTAATDNAEEMIRNLTLEYNKARQAGITTELAEIVSAGEATA